MFRAGNALSETGAPLSRPSVFSAHHISRLFPPTVYVSSLLQSDGGGGAGPTAARRAQWFHHLTLLTSLIALTVRASGLGCSHARGRLLVSRKDVTSGGVGDLTGIILTSTREFLFGTTF